MYYDTPTVPPTAPRAFLVTFYDTQYQGQPISTTVIEVANEQWADAWARTYAKPWETYSVQPATTKGDS